MKMSEVFVLPIEYQGVQLGDQDGGGVHCGEFEKDEAAAHAINCHDELVEALEYLLAAINCEDENATDWVDTAEREAKILLAKAKG